MKRLPRGPIILGLAVLAVVVHLSFCTWVLAEPVRPEADGARIARLILWPGKRSGARPREIALYARQDAGAAGGAAAQRAVAWGVVMPIVLLALAGLLAVRRRPPRSGRRNGTRARDPALVLAVREQRSRRRATGSDR